MASCSSCPGGPERAKAERCGRLFRHLHYYERCCSRKSSRSVVFARLPEAPPFTSVLFYWLPVRCNYPSAVLYRLPEAL